LELRHSDLSEALLVRLPEHIVTLEGLVAREVKWEKAAEDRWKFHWAANDALKRRTQTDFRGQVQLVEDGLLFTFIISNPTTLSWPSERYNDFDVVAGKLPMFHDPEGKRTYVYIKNRFVTVNEALKGQFSEDLTGWMRLANDPENPQFREYTERIMAKTSSDGKWVIGIASDIGDGVTFNLQPGTSCIHQNRTWSPLQPGEERTLHGRVYLFKGTLADLWTRYQHDKKRWTTEFQLAPGSEAHNAPSPRYIPTVWAPPTECRSLQRLRALRPVELPEHPLAAWVADYLARNSGKTPPLLHINRALKAFHRRGAFWIRNDDSGLWVSNGRVGIVILPASQDFAVASLYHIPTQSECILKPPTGGPPWQLLVRKGKTASILQDTISVTLMQTKVTTHTLRIELNWQGRWNVQARVALTAGSPLIHWGLTVNTHDNVAPPYALLFPVLKGLGKEKENDVVYSWGHGRGELFRALAGATGNSYHPTYPDEHLYPDCMWSVQFLAMTFGNMTLYLACHDSKSYTKAYKLHPGQEFYFVYFVPQDPPGYPVKTCKQVSIPYDIVIGPIAGDWFDAAKLYRRWAIHQPWCAKGPLVRRVRQGTIARRMIESPFLVRPNWTYDFEEPGMWERLLERKHVWGTTELKRNRQLFGYQVPLVVWWYKWSKAKFDDDTPIFKPYPGVPTEFRREVDDGLVVMPYTQSSIWDIDTELFSKAATCKNPDGSMRAGKWYWCTVAQMCLSQPLCQNITAGLAQTVADAGANAIYLDVFPCIHECWDASHGHPLGVGGYWWPESIREILRRIKCEQGQQFGIMMEYFAEPYIDLCDIQPGWWMVEESDCPLVPAIYSGYALVTGSSTHKDFPNDLVSFRIKQGRCFLWGSQLGGCYQSGYLDYADKAQFLKQLVHLRLKANNFLTYGEMLRPPRWLKPVPRVLARQWNMQHLGIRSFEYDAVECSLWRAPNRDLGLFIVNYDDKEHRVSLRAGDVFSDGARNAFIITADDERYWQRVKSSDELTVTVAPAQALLIAFRRS